MADDDGPAVAPSAPTTEQGLLAGPPPGEEPALLPIFHARPSAAAVNKMVAALQKHPVPPHRLSDQRPDEYELWAAVMRLALEDMGILDRRYMGGPRPQRATAPDKLALDAREWVATEIPPGAALADYVGSFDWVLEVLGDYPRKERQTLRARLLAKYDERWAPAPALEVVTAQAQSGTITLPALTGIEQIGNGGAAASALAARGGKDGTDDHCDLAEAA